MRISKERLKRRLFDFYRSYEHYFETDEKIEVEFFTEFNNFLADYLRREGCVILDVGCGAGKIVNKLAIEGNRGSFVLGVDISPLGVTIGKAASKSLRSIQPEFIVGDAEALPLKSESVDLVISNNLLEHLTDPEKCVFEMTGVLKTGGMLITKCPNSRFVSGPLKMSKIMRNPRIALKFSLYLLDYVRFILGCRLPTRFLQPSLSVKSWSSDKDAVCAINIFKAIEIFRRSGLKINAAHTWTIKHKILRKIPLLRFLGGNIILVAVKL